MSQRNDAKAVASAARAVNRAEAGELIRMMLRGLLPKVSPPKPVYAGADYGATPYARRWDGFLGRYVPVDQPATTYPTRALRPERARRSRTAKLDNPDTRQLVELSTWGKMPRYGTIRYTKASAVIEYLKARGSGCKVSRLVGLTYVHEGKAGAIDRHDLAVMHDKRLINIKSEGE